MLHFVTSYMKQNKSRKRTLESAQDGLEISFQHPRPRGRPHKYYHTSFTREKNIESVVCRILPGQEINNLASDDFLLQRWKHHLKQLFSFTRFLSRKWNSTRVLLPLLPPPRKLNVFFSNRQCLICWAEYVAILVRKSQENRLLD